jgi:hypothetical protein
VYEDFDCNSRSSARNAEARSWESMEDLPAWSGRERPHLTARGPRCSSALPSSRSGLDALPRMVSLADLDDMMAQTVPGLNWALRTHPGSSEEVSGARGVLAAIDRTARGPSVWTSPTA